VNDGTTFERAVARWLDRAGATTIKRRVRLPGDVAHHGHEVDVFVETVNTVWRFLLVVGLFSGFVAGVAAVTDLTTFAVTTGFLALVCTLLAITFRLDPKRIWVECKSGELTVRRDVVWKLAGQVEDVRNHALRKGTWYPGEVWIVARSRFDVDALAFAKKNRVRCFLEQSGDIREIV
jgi:hypothetical protein